MIILTGVSGGIGRFVFDQIEQKEAIIGVYNSNKLTPSYQGVSVKLNLEKHEKIKSFINDHRTELKNITLINMAAFSHDGLIANYTPSNLSKTFAINLFSNIYLVQALLPIMIEQKFGRIIHISSIVGQNGNVGAGIYSSSKSALIGYNKTLCKEYGRFGITSNILSLGYFEGGLINSLTEKKVAAITETIPSKKLGKPNEVLSALSFIRNCEYLNGEIINLHGGL